MKKIAVFGAGGLGREVHKLIEQINRQNSEWEFMGFFDDNLLPGTLVNGYPVLGGMEQINAYPEELALAIGVGEPAVKAKVVRQIMNPHIWYPVLIHPLAKIDGPDYVELSEGCIIAAGSLLTVNIKVGKFVFLNLDCTLGHDTVIGDFCSFMPSVNLSGELKIDSCVYVGTGAVIINQLHLGEGSVIGAGAVIVKDVPPAAVVVGNPGKIIKYKEALV
jgi:sugar O-acyltransferase (sialic acid O-acetyltransferase NeuD family)